MEDESDFYIVLPSNVPNIQGSQHENKTSNYKTILPRAIRVKDRRMYECALVEICFPQSWNYEFNIEPGCTYIYRPARYYRAMHNSWLAMIEEGHKHIPHDSLVRGLRQYLSLIHI